MSEIVKGILRAVSTGLQIPTIIILILLILLTIFMLGTFFAEMLTERKSLKLNIPKLVDELQGKSTSEMKDIVASSSLLTRQKAAAQELISRVTYPDDTREALARQLIADEESRYNRIIKITDLTARVAPMFGLMGTLIPLGPGLIALSEGDAATLSSSILIAFDTTVAGLISGALSYIVSGFRKGWYEEYMIGLETIMETVLDVQTNEHKKAQETVKATKPATADPLKATQVAQTHAGQAKAPQAQTLQGQAAKTPSAPQTKAPAQSTQAQMQAQAQAAQRAAVHEAARKRAAVEAQQEAARMQQMAARQAAQQNPAQPAAQAGAAQVNAAQAQAQAAQRAAVQEAARKRAAIEAQQQAARIQAAQREQSAKKAEDMSFDELLDYFKKNGGGQQ